MRRAVACDEEEGEPTLFDDIRDRVDAIAADIDIEDGEVEHAGHGVDPCIRDGPGLEDNAMPQLLDHGRKRHADQSLVFDEEYGSMPRHAVNSSSEVSR